MAVRCIQSTKAFTDFDYLDSNGREQSELAFARYIHDVGYITAIFHGEDDYASDNRMMSAAEGDKYVNKMLTDVLSLTPDEAARHRENGNSLWNLVRDASPEQRRNVLTKIDEHLKQLYMTIDNPEKVKEIAFESCRAKSILNWVCAQSRWSNKVGAESKNIAALFGGKHQLYGNKVAALEYYEPARKLFFNLNELETFTERTGKEYVHDILSAFRQISKTDIMKRNGVSQAHLSSMMEYFNGISDADDVGKHYQKFIEFAQDKELLSSAEIGDNIGRGLYSQALKAAKVWWRLNYGEEETTNASKANEYDEVNGVRVFKHTAGITGFFNTLRNKYTEGYQMYKRISAEHAKSVGFEPTVKDRAINDFFNKLQTHFFKNGYVPMSKVDELARTFADSDDEFRVWYADWMYKSKDDDDQESKIDFLKNVSDNILVTSQVFKRFSQITTARALEMQLDIEGTRGEGNWFSSRDRRDIRSGVEDLILDLNLKADYDASRQTTSARVVKSIGNVIQTFVGSYIMFPGSALKNYLGYGTAVLLRSGEKVKGLDWREAISNSGNANHAIAKQIDEYADKFLISAGLPDQFLSYAGAGGKGGDFIDRFNNFIGSIGNHIAKGGLPGEASRTYQQFLTVAGSEQIGRSAYIKRHMFNHALASLSVLELGHDGKVPKESIDAIIKDSAEKSWYEITNAMGLFSSTNKSFYFHAMSDTATTAPAAMAGMLMKVWNSFRHVAVTGIDNYIKAGIDYKYGKTIEGTTGLVKSMGYEGFLAMAGTILSLVIALFKDHEDVAFSPLTSLTPIDNPISGMKVLGVQAASLLGANVSEENYRMIMEDGLNFLVGAAGGRYAADMYAKEADNLLRFYGDPISTTLSVMKNGEIAGTVGALYNERQKLRDSFGFLLASDPIYLAERAVELGFIRSTDPNATKSYLVNTGSKTLATILGLSLYSMPYYNKKINRQSSRDVDNDRYVSYIKTGRHVNNYVRQLYSRDLTERAENALEKYGRVPKTLTTYAP